MLEVKLRPKGQITIPASVMKAAKLKADATMRIDYINGVITLTPIQQKSDPDDIMRYAGSLAGMWGATPEEMERNIALERSSWER
jgi:bifunctional DNA-binding transcriptional regulator/antitoxin component of YhaV-PrlF toxin-antitoxin module